MKKVLLALAIAASATACSTPASQVNLVCYNPATGSKTVEYQGANEAGFRHSSRTWTIRYHASDDADAGVVIYQQAQGESCSAYEVE